MEMRGRWIAIATGVGAAIALALAAFLSLRPQFVLDDAYRQQEEPAGLVAAFRRAVTDEPEPRSPVYYLSFQNLPGVEKDPSEELLSRLNGLEATWGPVKVLPASKADRKPSRSAKSWGPFCSVTILKWLSV